jgi:epoxyqueuosine reductase
LPAILELDDEAFRHTFRGSPIKRAKRRGLARNAAVALGNQRPADARPVLERAASDDPEPLVRDAAAWAVARLDSSS